MWLIPTRNRPHMLAELIAAMRAVGDVPECAVMHDACPIYDIDWPANWHLHHSPEHLEMSGALNELYRLHPGETFYGMVDDHNRPMVAGWSAAMQKAAGAWGMASVDTGKNRVNPATGRLRINCYALGGDLARALGWVWPDFVVHLYGDDVLEDIGYELGLLVHVHAARFDNLLMRDGRLKPDLNHARMYQGQNYVEHDRMAYAQWKRSQFRQTVERIRKAMDEETVRNA